MSENNGTAKVICILDYVGILFLLGLFVEKDNPNVKFHTNQGLILFLLEIVLGVVGTILGFLPFVGGLLAKIWGLAYLLPLIFAILGIVNAAQDQCKPLPVIGGLFQFIK